MSLHFLLPVHFPALSQPIQHSSSYLLLSFNLKQLRFLMCPYFFVPKSSCRQKPCCSFLGGEAGFLQNPDASIVSFFT